MKKYKLVQIENNRNVWFTTNEIPRIDLIDVHPVTNAPLKFQAYELIPNDHELLVQYNNGFLERWEVEDD